MSIQAALLHDELVHIFEFCDESDYLNFRLVCKLWHSAVETNLCITISPHVLVRTQRYLSAVRLMNGPRSCRSGIPLHPHMVLREACSHSHCGIIRYILTRFKNIKPAKVNDAIERLTIGGAAIVFYEHGYDCKLFALEHTVIHNSIKLAKYLPSQYSISADDIEHVAARGYIELARIIRSKIEIVTGMTDDIFRNIYELNFDIAMLFVKFVSDDMKIILYDNILNEHAIAIKYHEAVRELAPAVTALKEKIAREAALNNILSTVKKAIVRGLRRIYPEIEDPINDVRIRFNLSHEDMVQINWDLPWNYTYEIKYDYVDGRKVISEFYVYRIYNSDRVEEEVRIDNSACILS